MLSENMLRLKIGAGRPLEKLSADRTQKKPDRSKTIFFFYSKIMKIATILRIPKISFH